MRNILIVVDIQKDFVDGALGTAEAVGIVPAAAERIREFGDEIFVTKDTHFEDYMDTAEGKNLPVPHCIRGSEGWELDKEIEKALEGKNARIVEKYTFGSDQLPGLINEPDRGRDMQIELIGLCTDICVVSNALLLKAFYPEAMIS